MICVDEKLFFNIHISTLDRFSYPRLKKAVARSFTVLLLFRSWLVVGRSDLKSLPCVSQPAKSRCQQFPILSLLAQMLI
jgi:hypothetical protein